MRTSNLLKISSVLHESVFYHKCLPRCVLHRTNFLFWPNYFNENMRYVSQSQKLIHKSDCKKQNTWKYLSRHVWCALISGAEQRKSIRSYGLKWHVKLSHLVRNNITFVFQPAHRLLFKGCINAKSLWSMSRWWC